MADPSADLPPFKPRQPARARLQRGRHDHHPVRHGRAQRPRSLPPGDRRDRSRPPPDQHRRPRQTSVPRSLDRPPSLHRAPRRRSPRHTRLALESITTDSISQVFLAKLCTRFFGSRHLRAPPSLSALNKFFGSRHLRAPPSLSALNKFFGSRHLRAPPQGYSPWTSLAPLRGAVRLTPEDGDGIVVGQNRRGK